MTETVSSAEPVQTTGRRSQRNLITGLLLMVAAWAIYLPSLSYDFVYYDDVRILRDHPELYGQGGLSDSGRAIFVTGFPREEPLLLRDVSWSVDSHIFGFGNPFGYHLGNVLLHGVVAALMFAFLLGTTRRYGFALAVTVAWVALAIHTEPVDWIMGRKDILSALFMLLALCSQTRRLAAKGRGARSGWLLVTLIFFVCGLFSKISVLTFPLVLFLHAMFAPYLNGERPASGAFVWGRSLLEEIFLMVPFLAVSLAVYHWYRQTLGQMGILDRGGPTGGPSHLWSLLMIDPAAIGIYARQIFLPWHLKVFYQWPALLDVYPRWQVAGSLAAVVVATGAGLWLFCQRKDLFFYYAAFFVIMVPYLNLVIPGILVAERYAYFSAFCLLAMAVSVVMNLGLRPQRLWRGCATAVGTGFLAFNLFQTFSYQPAWRNGETLWQYHLTLPQPGPAAYDNLAAYYYAQAAAQTGTPEMAVHMNKMAVVVDAGLQQFWGDHAQPPPSSAYFLFFLQSIVQQVKGENDAALDSLLMSDRLRPNFDSTYLNLALLYHQLAETAADPKQGQTYALAARDCYEGYVKLAYGKRTVPAGVQKKLSEFAAACPANQPVEKK